MATIVPTDPDDGVKTDEVHKKLDFDRPFHRIGNRFGGGADRRPPSFRPDLSGPTIDGKGFDRDKFQGFESCRRPADLKAVARTQGKLLGEITAELARAVPAWIRVTPSGVAPPLFQEPDSAFQEVEGVLVRSFQTWTDFPVAQYHVWYDWNFHIEPVEGYRHLPGPANAVPPEELKGRTPVVKGATPTMECEWDTGAFGKKPGSMFLADWCWPMAGDFTWIAGRWIYDCGHANRQEQVRTELHPGAAVATARWEGVKFASDRTEIVFPKQPGSANAIFRPARDTLAVPGIRFMFFASKAGGYHNFRSLGNPNQFADKSYRFIVDLPRIAADARTIVIGTSDNTAVLLNPRLLVSFAFDDFANNVNGKFQRVDPIITVLDPGKGKLPEQVIIEIPIDKLDADTAAYGVIVSMGWHDEANVLARRVLKCEVNFVLADIPDSKARPQSLSDQAFLVRRWTIKFGVNGRWFRHETGPLGIGPTVNNIRHRFPEFFMPIDFQTVNGVREAEFKINSHGKILMPVGEFIQKDANTRSLKIQGRTLQYDVDIAHGRDSEAVAIVEQLALMQAATFKQQNEAIGIMDVKETVARVVAAGGTRRIFPPALEVEELDPLAELVFVNDKPGQEKIDYRLSISFKTSPQ